MGVPTPQCLKTQPSPVEPEALVPLAYVPTPPLRRWFGKRLTP